MNQDQLMDQFLDYGLNNLYNDTILKAIMLLLENISSELYENGYINASDQLTTCYLKIKKVLEMEDL